MRALIENILSEIPQKPLYHYTSQTGLLGIVRHREIWATNIHYLNDTAEFAHAIELVTTEFENRKGVSPKQDMFLAFLTKQLALFKHIDVYVCSFSEQGDLLSQWRGYCPSGNGLISVLSILNCVIQ